MIEVSRPICPITIEVIQIPAVLPCGHVFEENAISKWLEVKRDCPTCRREVDSVDPNPQPARNYFLIDLEAQTYHCIDNHCSAAYLTLAVGIAIFVTTIFFQNFY